MVSAICRYLKYVLRHKYFVYREGRRLKVGRWQLLVHDLSKFSPTEFVPYLWYFNLRARWEKDPVKAKQVKADFDRAWLHHIHKNPHHWQHWVLRTDTEGVKVLEIPDKFVREMIADWEGVGAALGKPAGHAARWYKENRETMALHHLTRALVEGYLFVGTGNNCLVPPEGWYCTRPRGHTGPCAALPDEHGRETVSPPTTREAGT